MTPAARLEIEPRGLEVPHGKAKGASIAALAGAQLVVDLVAGQAVAMRTLVRVRVPLSRHREPEALGHADIVLAIATVEAAGEGVDITAATRARVAVGVVV